MLDGVVSLDALGAAADRVLPVLVFLVAVTVLAELCDASGLFDEVAHVAARVARGRTITLFLLVVLVATVTTAFLSLDTTAVLLTPVVLALADRLELDAAPFAMSTVWLSATASLFLPVSNLTNLLAVDALGVTAREYAALLWRPAAAVVVVTVGLLLVLHRRSLRGRYQKPERLVVDDRVLLGSSAAAAVVLVVLVLLEVPVAVAAAVPAALLALVFVVRRREVLRWKLLPWQVVLLVSALFVVVEIGREHGLTTVLQTVAGTGDGWWDHLRLAASAAGGANLVNNLPAYLALEPIAADSSARQVALLVGVNAGALVTLWGSLSTLLWWQRCRARGVRVSVLRFAGAGLLLVPVALVTAISVIQ